MIGNDSPDHIVRNPVIFVPKDIADAAYLFPRHVWCWQQQVVGNMPACFRDNLQSALDCEAQKPIPFEIIEGFAGRVTFDTVYRIQDLGQNRRHATLGYQKTRTADCSMSWRNKG